MDTFRPFKQEDVWSKIEAEKRRDRLVRRISIVAWAVTLAVLLVFTVMVGIEVSRTLALMRVGAVSSGALVGVIMPFIAVVGTVSLLIAVLSTVGVFLRLRTSSLSEIQWRLAALEQMLVAGPGSEEGGVPS